MRVQRKVVLRKNFQKGSGFKTSIVILVGAVTGTTSAMPNFEIYANHIDVTDTGS